MKLDKIKEFVKKRSNLIIPIGLYICAFLLIFAGMSNRTPETEIPITNTANNTQSIINSVRIYNLEAYNRATANNTAAWAKLFNNLKTPDISGKADKAELQKLSDELAILNNLLDRLLRDSKLNQEQISNLFKSNNELRKDLIYYTPNSTIYSGNVTGVKGGIGGYDELGWYELFYDSCNGYYKVYGIAENTE